MEQRSFIWRYPKGLAPSIQDLLVPLDLPTDLDALITLATRTDNRRLQFQRQRESKLKIPVRVTTAPDSRWPTSQWSLPDAQPHLLTTPEEEAMQLGRARLTPEEHQKRQQEGRWFYCGGVGHLISSCPVKKSQVVSQIQVSKPVPCTLTKVKLNSVNDLEVRSDSGADESLMDWGLAISLGIESEPLAIRAKSLNGK